MNAISAIDTISTTDTANAVGANGTISATNTIGTADTTDTTDTLNVISAANAKHTVNTVSIINTADTASRFPHMEGDRSGLGTRGGDFPRDAQPPAFHQFRDGRMVFDVLIQLRHQRALAVPLVRSDDMHASGLERIRRAHHGPDVEIVRPILHGDLKIMTAMRVEIGLDGADRPIAVSVEHVAPIALVKQHRIKARVIVRRRGVVRTRRSGMRLRPRSDTHLAKYRFA